MKVQELMTGKIITVSPEEPVSVAARLLSRYNIGSLPVCTRDGKLRGLVTDRDIVLRCVAADEDPTEVRVSEVMTRRPVSVQGADDIKSAASIMSERQVRRLPVEENGKLIGMLSLGDLAKVSDLSAEAAAALGGISENIRYL